MLEDVSCGNTKLRIIVKWSFNMLWNEFMTSKYENKNYNNLNE